MHVCLKETICFVFQEYFYPKYVGKFAAFLEMTDRLFLTLAFLWRTLPLAVCLGSHRVGINNQYSDIPTDLRKCVTGKTLWCRSPFFPVHFLHQPFFFEPQRSVTSARRSRATGRVLCSAWMARVHTGVCANLAGRGNAARTVSWKIKNHKHPRTDLRTHTHSHFWVWCLLTCHCADVDECSDPEFPAGCNHKCINIPGSFQCQCESGYMSDDKITCVGKIPFGPAVLFGWRWSYRTPNSWVNHNRNTPPSCWNDYSYSYGFLSK